MKREYKEWSTSELRKAIELRKQGKTAKEIGKILDRKAENVRTKLYVAGYPVFEVKYWTPEEWKHAQSLREKGMLYKDIGEILGRDYHSIANKFHSERNKLKSI